MIKLNKDILQLAIRAVGHPEPSIIVMCSAGVDSIAAAHFFTKKYHSKLNNVFFLHINHMQRKQNNLMEHKFLQFASEPQGVRSTIGYNIVHKCELYPFIKRLNVTPRCTEDQLRESRIQLITEQFHKCVFVTAHHLDDCVESHLLNVLRGKEEYQPMPFYTKVGENVIVHPFVFTRKKDFVEYATHHNLMQYVEEDETNKITKGSRRNMIRNKIIPTLEEERVGLATIVKKKMKKRLVLEILRS